MSKFEGMRTPSIRNMNNISGNDMPNAVSRRQTGVKSIKRHNRVAPKGLAFGMLEPCAFNGARTVLRGLGDGNIPWLLDP